MAMTAVTVNAGKKIVVANGNGSATTYVATDTVSLPAAEAAKLIKQGLVTAA